MGIFKRFFQQRRSSAYLTLGGLAFIFVALLVFKTQSSSVIRIGVIVSQSGTMAVSASPLLDAATLAVEEINAQGGLLGHKVEIAAADGRSDAQQFAREAARLIEQEKVSALFACWTSSCRKAIKPIVEERNHLLFYPITYEGAEYSPNIIYTGSVPNQQIIPAIHWMVDQFGSRIYLVGSDYVFPRMVNHVVSDLSQALDAHVVGESYFPLGGRDVAAIIERIRAAKPDVIFNTINGDSNAHFFSALEEAGLSSIPVLSSSLAEEDLRAMPALAAHPQHYVASGYFQSLDSEANRQFVTKFQRRFGKDKITSDPIESMYSSVKLWAGAVVDAATDDPAQVNRAIIRQSIAAPSGEFAVDAATRHVWKRLRIGHAKPDGQFDQVYSSQYALRPTPFPTFHPKSEWERDVDFFDGESR